MVRRALADYTRDDAAERQYTYLQRDDVHMLDGSGNLKRRDLHTYDVTLLEGSRYRRLVKRNDQPLPPDEEKQQQANLQRSIEERRKKTPEQRLQRIAEWERKRQERQKDIDEVPDAFDLNSGGRGCNQWRARVDYRRYAASRATNPNRRRRGISPR